MANRLPLTFGPGTVLRLLTSLVLALLLWGWVTNVQDPEETEVYAGIPIAEGTLPSGYEIVTALPMATVRLTGPSSVLARIDQSNVKLQLSTDDIQGPGEYQLRVDLVEPDNVREHEVTPSEVAVNVEETMTRLFPLDYRLPELPPEDTRQVGDLRPDVSEVTVSGARSLVDRVATVTLPIDIGERSGDFRAAFEPRAIDSEGNEIREVTIAPRSVPVLVPISARGKSVAVITQVVGEPAEGYEVVDRTVNPATILVDGPRDVLENTISVSTGPVDISGATTNVARRVQIESPPAGLRILEPSGGNVDVVVQIRRRGIQQSLPSQPVDVVGVAPGLQVTVSPAELALVVVASEEEIAALSREDLKLQVDVSNLGPGTYERTPNVSLPPNVEWITTEPSRVTVTLSATVPGASPGVQAPIASATPPASPAASDP
ncbi:MAG: CdaR family protein [Chloroflexota bacterium]|nr:CdaR family protein [Chloroflexota bacterium]